MLPFDTYPFTMTNDFIIFLFSVFSSSVLFQQQYFMAILFLLRKPEEFYKMLDFHGNNKYPSPTPVWSLLI